MASGRFGILLPLLMVPSGVGGRKNRNIDVGVASSRPNGVCDDRNRVARTATEAPANNFI
eukprot:11065652-Lingulodinium_polyedra.AAC.1